MGCKCMWMCRCGCGCGCRCAVMDGEGQKNVEVVRTTVQGIGFNITQREASIQSCRGDVGVNEHS
jgi:hypothetical protein